MPSASPRRGSWSRVLVCSSPTVLQWASLAQLQLLLLLLDSISLTISTSISLEGIEGGACRELMIDAICGVGRLRDCACLLGRRFLPLASWLS